MTELFITENVTKSWFATTSFIEPMGLLLIIEMDLNIGIDIIKCIELMVQRLYIQMEPLSIGLMDAN